MIDPRNGRGAAPLALLLALTAGPVLALVACERSPAGGGPARVEGNRPAEKPETPPGTIAPARDVVLVTIDTWRFDAAGFAGNERVSTPTLDRLAIRGRVYDAARAHAVHTLPSHASILTGRLPFEHGIRANNGFVLADVRTLADELAATGFATGAFVAAAPLDARYGHLLPGMAESTVNFVYGRQFATDPSLVLGALFA